MHLVVARAHVHGAVLLLTLADDENVVELRRLRAENLLRERQTVVVIDVDVVAGIVDGGAHLLGKGLELGRDGEDDRLPRGQPEGPLAPKALRENRNHALDRAQDGAVDDDGALLLLRLGAHVRQVEPIRQVEVKLDRRALVRALEGVHDRNVDLGPVERAVLGILLPVRANLLREPVERLGQLRLRTLPHREVAEVVLRARRQREAELEAEDTVDGLEEIKGAIDFRLDLVLRTENVRVVLLEAPHAREARERTRQLVAMEDAKVGHAEGQLLVRPHAVVEHQAVAGAVHRLERKRLLLDLKFEHVLRIMLPVARRLPQLRVVHVRRDDLLEAALHILAPNQCNEFVVNAGPVRQEEAAAGAQLVEKVQLLLLANLAVVSLGRLLLQLLPLGELLGVRERNAVHALQRLGLSVAFPVRSRALCDHERLDPARVAHMGPAAKVDERTAAIHRRAFLLDALRDDAPLELVVLEHLEEVGLRHFEALKLLPVLHDALRNGFESGEFLGVNRLVPKIDVIVEALLNRWAVAETPARAELEGLSDNVRARVPVDGLRLVAVPFEERQAAAPLERTLQVKDLAVDLRNDRVVRKTLAYAKRNFQGRRAPRLALHHFPIWQRDLDGLGRLGGNFLVVLLLEPVEDLVAVLNVIGLRVQLQGTRGRVTLRLALLLVAAAVLGRRWRLCFHAHAAHRRREVLHGRRHTTLSWLRSMALALSLTHTLSRRRSLFAWECRAPMYSALI
eukprot:Opistho-1_new@106270